MGRRADSAVTGHDVPVAAPRHGGQARLAYLDWLRFLVVLFLAPFHAALSYTGYGFVYVYDNPVRDAVLAGQGLYGNFGPAALRDFTVFMDNWGMHLLFVVAGMGTAMSLGKRSAPAFVGERADRLLKPLLLMTLTVIPIQAWLRALDFGTFTGGFFAFYPHFFNGINTGPGSRGNFDWGHLWFLAYLFVFSVAMLPIFERRRRKRAPAMARGAWLLAFPPLIGALEAALRPGWPGALNLVSDWANVAVFLCFFVFGYLAGIDPWIAEAVERHRMAALALGLAAFLARVACYRWLPVGSGYDPFNMLAQFLRGMAACGLVAAALGLGRRHLELTGRWWRVARDLSFPLYLLHYAPVTAATYLLLDSTLGIWPRWALSVAVSWITVALCTFVFRYIPPLRALFGIAPPRHAGARAI